MKCDCEVRCAWFIGFGILVFADIEKSLVCVSGYVWY